MTVTLEYTSGSAIQQSFDVVLFTGIRNDQVSRRALDGSDLTIIHGYWKLFQLHFKYLSDAEISFLENFIPNQQKRINVSGTWYDVELDGEREFVRIDRSNMKLKLISKTRY